MNRSLRALAVCVLLSAFAPWTAGSDLDAVCTALVNDERARLADYGLDVDLGQLRLAAFEEIYELIHGLWEGEAIARMAWLEAQHDRDAARLELERARLILARQRHHVEQFQLACAASVDDRAGKIREARRSYLKADCDQQAKAIEVARVNLEFNREWLASIRDLRGGSTGTATAQDVILAELDVELEERRLADATTRTASCRKQSPPPKASAAR